MSGLHEVLICAKDLHICQMPEDYLIINLTKRLHARACRQPSNPYDSRAVLSLEGSYSDPRVRNALIIIVRQNRKQPSYGVLGSECIRKMSSHTSWRKMMMKRLCYFPFYESAWFDLSWKCIYIWKKKVEPRWDQRSGRLPVQCRFTPVAVYLRSRLYILLRENLWRYISGKILSDICNRVFELR